MRSFLCVGITVVCFFVSIGYCDISVSYSINTETGQAPISPYIYGYNFDHVTGDNLTVRRMGGNRLTGYNWENNFSNAGSDWQHYSDTKVTPSMSDKVNSSIYASTFTDDHGILTLMVLNKNLTEAIAGTFTISSPRTFTSARVWAFDSSSPTITELTAVSTITGNSFAYTIPALTACHFVLEAEYPAGDLNGNCHVGLEDLVLFAAQWLDTGGCSGIDCADLLADNIVRLEDFSILSENWGVGIPCQ